MKKNNRAAAKPFQPVNVPTEKAFYPIFQSTDSWILLGFLLATLLFYIIPTFLNADQIMKQPKLFFLSQPIGLDMRETMNYTSWFLEHHTPYTLVVRGGYMDAYPPLVTLYFIPHVYLGYNNAYLLNTAMILSLYLVGVFVLPMLTSGQWRLTPAILLVAFAGLFSYGLGFELERGQFNLITVACSLTAIVLFHYFPRWRRLAYVFFVISVQLKLYPAIFIVMLVDNWRDWKPILKRFTLLGVANFLALFLLGFNNFLLFLKAYQNNAGKYMFWDGNHAIKSFAVLAQKAYGWPEATSEHWLLAVYFLLLGTLWLLSVWRRPRGFNPYLLLGCTIGALIIPPLSHDYTLSYLAAPVAVLLNLKYDDVNGGTLRLLGQRFAILALAFAFFTTTFSIDFKAYYGSLLLHNNFPPLLLIMLATVCLFAMNRTVPATQQSATGDREQTPATIKSGANSQDH